MPSEGHPRFGSRILEELIGLNLTSPATITPTTK